jgi:ankyrin repeat protein
LLPVFAVLLPQSTAAAEARQSGATNWASALQLQQAVLEKDVETVRRLLRQQQQQNGTFVVDPSTAALPAERHQRTPMYFAARGGPAELVQLLLDRQLALVNASTNSEGMAPLHVAAMARRPELVRLLRRRGADLWARDRHRNVALHFAVVRYFGFYYDEHASALPSTEGSPVAVQRRLDTVKALLAAQSSAEDDSGGGRLLLPTDELNSLATATNDAGETPLNLALAPGLAFGGAEVARLLLAYVPDALHRVVGECGRKLFFLF